MKKIQSNYHINGINEIKDVIRSNNIEINSKKAVIVIGNTREGKSTLINYLEKNELYVEKTKTFPSQFIIKARNILSGIKIGNTTVSETTIPNKLKSQVNDLVYWDCPGFGDTKGWVQDITNGFYVEKLFSTIQEVKILLVISEKTMFAARSGKFLTLLKKLANFFVDLEQAKKALILVITKATCSDVALCKKAIKEQLYDTNKVHLEENGYYKVLELFKYLFSPEMHVAFFLHPKVIGKLDTTNSDQIMHVINKIQYRNIGQVIINVDDDSLIYCSDCAIVLNNNIIDVCYKIREDLLLKIKTVIFNSFSSKEACTTLNLLKQHITELNQKEAKDFIIQYKNLCEKFSLISRLLDINLNLDLLNFISKINSNIKYDISNWVSKLSVNDVLEALCLTPQYLISSNYHGFGRTLVIKSNILDINNIVSLIEKNSDKNFKNVLVFVFECLYSNEDLNVDYMRGKNISIITHYWKQCTYNAISVKGQKGEKYFTKAQNGYGQFDSGIGCHGEDGKAGKPGLPGGNIVCYSNKFIGKGELTLDVRGGDGGNGQNGGNGARGERGSDANSNVTKDSKHKKQTESGNSVVDVYYNEGSLGSKGGDAGMGGKGGLGGYAGIVKCNFDHKTLAFKGENGLDGNAGKPGLGGIRGANYEAEHQSYIRSDAGISLGFVTLGMYTVIAGIAQDGMRASKRITHDDFLENRGESGSRPYVKNHVNRKNPKDADRSFANNMENIYEECFIQERKKYISGDNILETIFGTNEDKYNSFLKIGDDILMSSDMLYNESNDNTSTQCILI